MTDRLSEIEKRLGVMTHEEYDSMGRIPKKPHKVAEFRHKAPSDIRYLLDLVRRQQAVVEVADKASTILETLIWREDHLENTIGMRPGQAVHAQAIDRLRHALDKLDAHEGDGDG